MEALRKRHISEATTYPLGCEGLSTYHFREERDHPISSKVTMFAPCGIRVMSPYAAVRALPPQPKLGQHTREVLRDELNLSEEELDRLLRDGVVAEERSKLYIPRGDPWGEDIDVYLASLTSNSTNHSKGLNLKPKRVTAGVTSLAPPATLLAPTPKIATVPTALSKSADSIMDDPSR